MDDYDFKKAENECELQRWSLDKTAKRFLIIYVILWLLFIGVFTWVCLTYFRTDNKQKIEHYGK